MGEKMITISGLAEAVGVSPNTARRYVRLFPDYFPEKTIEGITNYEENTIAVAEFIYEQYQEGLSQEEIAANLKRNFKATAPAKKDEGPKAASQGEAPVMPDVILNSLKQFVLQGVADGMQEMLSEMRLIRERVTDLEQRQDSLEKTLPKADSMVSAKDMQKLGDQITSLEKKLRQEQADSLKQVAQSKDLADLKSQVKALEEQGSGKDVLTDEALEPLRKEMTEMRREMRHDRDSSQQQRDGIIEIIEEFGGKLGALEGRMRMASLGGSSSQEKKESAPAKAPEPAKAREPAKAPEPAKTPEPAKAKEPVKTPEPAKAKEPSKAPEPAKAKTPEPDKAREQQKPIPPAPGLPSQAPDKKTDKAQAPAQAPAKPKEETKPEAAKPAQEKKESKPEPKPEPKPAPKEEPKASNKKDDKDQDRGKDRDKDRDNDRDKDRDKGKKEDMLDNILTDTARLDEVVLTVGGKTETEADVVERILSETIDEEDIGAIDTIISKSMRPREEVKDSEEEEKEDSKEEVTIQLNAYNEPATPPKTPGQTRQVIHLMHQKGCDLPQIVDYLILEGVKTLQGERSWTNKSVKKVIKVAEREAKEKAKAEKNKK